MTALRRVSYPLIALLAACGGGPPGGGQARSDDPLVPSVHDSDGVSILEYSAKALAQAPLVTIDTAAIASIGKGDAELDLSRVYSVIILHDGSLAFFIKGTVHVVSPDGKDHKRIGRDGAGPGEFRDGELAWGRGDTILVSDPTNSRVNWVVPSKGVVRTRAVPLNQPGVGFGAIAQFDHDTLIMGTVNYYPQSASPGHGTPFPVGLLTGASDSIRILVPLEGGEMRMVPELASNGLGGQAAVRYPPVPQAGAWGDGFLAVRPDHWHLDRFHPSGVLMSSVRIATPRTPMTKALRDLDVAGTIAAWKARPGAPPDTSSMYKMFALFPYPDSLPSFGNVTTTPGGIAWVRDQRLSADTTWGFTAVAADGKIVGRLLGHGRPPIAFGDDRVVVRKEDADGVVTWQVMALKWGNAK